MAVFAHEKPDRVPMWFGMSPEFQENAKRQFSVDDEGLRRRFRDDFRRVIANYAGPNYPLSEDAASRTVFGVERSGLGYGHPLSHPLAGASLGEIHGYCWPNPSWIDVSGLKDAALSHKGEFAILGGDWSPFWHDAIDLMGMEELLVNMYTRPQLVHALFDHLLEYYLEVNNRIFAAAGGEIDIFFIGNDFGSQNGPLVGPEIFEEFLLRYLQRLIDLGHSYDLRVQLHCCGGFAEMIPHMIQAGLDGLHAIQPCCKGMDLRDLKKNFGDKIVFNGAIDSHHVLIKGTQDSVAEQTRNVLDIMMPGSGYIAGASHDYILYETPLENILAMSDTVYEFGRY